MKVELSENIQQKQLLTEILNKQRTIIRELVDVRTLLSNQLEISNRGKDDLITPDEAAKLSGRTVLYLVRRKDFIGLRYAQSMRKGKVMFYRQSIIDYITGKTGKRRNRMRYDKKDF